jgi:hypothetical protein
MRWLWFVAAIAFMAVAFRTHSMGLAAISLLGILVCVLMGTLAVASRRIEGRSRDAIAMMSPEDMRRMREQIEKRKRDGETGAIAAGGGAATGNRFGDPDQDVDSVSGDGPSSND